MKGKIVKIQFKNKAGRVLPDVSNYFFEIKGERYLIKFRESDVEYSEVEDVYEQKKEIQIKGEICNGLWDSDDPKVQSRVGKYVIIDKILY